MALVHMLVSEKYRLRLSVRIVWERSIYGGNGRVPCIICGGWANPIQRRGHQVLVAVVYNDRGQVYGEACRSCVNLGAQGIKEYLQERIARLRNQLQDLQELEQGEVELPTLEEELSAYLE
ncbi:MAG: hypothetical protein Q6K80_04965 [Thermostichus sp. DG_1_6_bins_120]